MKKVIIWGAGELGQFVLRQIRVYFKIWDCNGIVDRNKALWGNSIYGEDEQVIESPEILRQKQCDLLIICANKYLEIAETAEKIYGLSKNRMMWVDTLWPRQMIMHPQQKWEKLVFMPFIADAPEYKEMLDELAHSEGLLNELGIKYKTDKAQIMYEKEGFRLTHDYLRHYQWIFDNIRDDKNILCELGCGTGASLKMWKEYLKKSLIVGVDINECANSFREDRIDIVIGNAAHDETIREIKEKYKRIDIIIDDASHAWGDMRVSFEKLWDVLAPGGIYIIEDTSCGSMGAFPQYPPTCWDAQSIFDYILDRTKIMNFARDWNPEYNRYHFEHLPKHIQRIERELDEIQISHGTIIIRKR